MIPRYCPFIAIVLIDVCLSSSDFDNSCTYVGDVFEIINFTNFLIWVIFNKHIFDRAHVFILLSTDETIFRSGKCK